MFSQSQAEGWERRSGDVAGHRGIRGQEGYTRTFPYPRRDVSEGWEEGVHMPTGVTYVTEKHFFLVKRAVTHLTLGIIREGTGRGGGERVCGPGRG